MMKPILLGLFVFAMLPVTLSADNYCVRSLQSIGVGYSDARRECRNAGFSCDDMAWCAVELNRRGVRGDHAVRECQRQGVDAYRFTRCVIYWVDQGVRTDKAVRRCR